MPELKLYTVADLREWVMHNRAAEGLSERFIAPTRAWAIIHNPYVHDQDPVVAVIFVDNEAAACTTAFPELIGNQRYWWFSALWCRPKYQGKGYGLIVIGAIAEVYGAEYCLDRWGAVETVAIFNYLKHKTIYTPRYILGAQIKRTTTKGKIVFMVRQLQRSVHAIFEQSLKKETYSLRYMPFIDDATYEFIVSHRNDYSFLHTQEFMNWVLRYTMTISAPLLHRVENQTPFSASEAMNSQIFAVQVHDCSQIIGFYLMKKVNDSLYILYLYYDEEQRKKVYASIRDHVKYMNVTQCVSENKDLADYLRSQIYFPKYNIASISFSYPDHFFVQQSIKMQCGDGD